MLANGIKQSAIGGTSNLTLASVGAFPALSKKYAAGLNGDPIPYALVRDSDGVGIEWGLGHLADASTFVRDRVMATWNGTVYNDVTPIASDLTTGGPYTLAVADNASLRSYPLAATLDVANGVRFLMSGHWNVAPSATIALPANTLVGLPFRLDKPAIATGIALTVKTAATTGTFKNMRAALYRIDPLTGKIGALIMPGAAVSVASTGVKVSLLESAVRLESAWYAAAVISDGNASYAGTNTMGGTGQFPAWGVPNGDPTGRYNLATKTGVTYVDTGALFPDVFPVPTTYGSDSTIAQVCPTLAVSA